MRTLFAIILFAIPAQVIPEQLGSEWWQPWNFGAPCTTQIDIEEGTCGDLGIRSKPDWSKQ